MGNPEGIAKRAELRPLSIFLSNPGAFATVSGFMRRLRPIVRFRFAVWLVILTSLSEIIAQDGGRIAPPPLPGAASNNSSASPGNSPMPTAGSATSVPSETPPSAPAGSGPTPVAMPVETGAPDPPAAFVANPDDFLPRAKKIEMPKGPLISEEQQGARIIEVEVPERVPVYPDDPESAWWEINPHYAFDRAQREQKPLLLLFTGMWNTQAMSLSEEVFATKSFNDLVKEHLVICYLSYPRNITDAPPTLRRLKEKFKVRGYPNVLLFNPNGEVERGIRGYRSGRPVDYFNHLVAACQPVFESIKVQKAQLVSSGYRDWSNYLGKLIFARFVERDATRAVLQDASGQKWTVPINDLAPDDQRMVESFPAVATVGSG